MVSAEGWNLDGLLLTLRMWSSLIQPGTSLLFLKTRREAPIRRCVSLALKCWKRWRRWRWRYLLDQQAFQLLTAVIDTLPIGGIDYPDKCVRLLKVVLPVCSERLLASDVPFTHVSGNRSDVMLSHSQIFSLYLLTSSAYAKSPTHMTVLTLRSRWS